MKIRFQADADLKHAIVSGMLRRIPGMDFQTALAADLQGLEDPEVLALAAREGRILVLHDKRTMPYHFAEFIKAQTSPGLIIVPQQMAIASAVEELLLIGLASEPDEWINRICHLPLLNQSSSPGTNRSSRGSIRAYSTIFPSHKNSANIFQFGSSSGL